jgi:hypothetical protein
MRAHPVLLSLIVLLAASPASARIIPVDLGPGHSGWSLQLVPGPQQGAVAVYRILVFDAKGKLRQTIQHRAEPGAAQALLSPVIEDLDFDGYRDLAITSELGTKWATYHVWRFEPRRGEFVKNGITLALGGLGPRPPRASRPATVATGSRRHANRAPVALR